MLDLISIGNINADLFFDAGTLTTHEHRYSLAIGGKYPVKKFEMHVGGGGANVAIGCRKLGLRTAVVGVVGNHIFRKGILQRLHQAKVSTKLLMFNQTDIRVSTILLAPNGERTIIHHETPHKHLAEEKHTIKSIVKTRGIYFGNLPDISMRDRRTLMKQCRDKGVFIIVNVGKQDCCKPKTYVNELLEYADVLILNTHEFAEIVKQPVEKLDFRTYVVKHLPIMREKVVIITAAEKGSYGYERGNVYFQKAIRPKKIKDTTGAGDAYTAGFTAYFLKHEDMQKAMKHGALYASRVLGHIGAN